MLFDNDDLRTHRASLHQSEAVDEEDSNEECDDESGRGLKKKDKKLVFLSRSVLKCVRQQPNTTGTEIAYVILELYK
jgi:hypothetical protein